MEDKAQRESDHLPADPGLASRTSSSENDREHTDAELASDWYTGICCSCSRSESSRGSTIFSKAQDVTVSGGSFTNITHNYNSVPTVFSDFRSIRLGDIDLRDLRLDIASGVVGHLCERRSARRVYAARIEGQKAEMTVAMYHHEAEEARRVHFTFNVHYDGIRSF
ncbi:hypothetical protein DFH06DRAFT_510935 [Mycena polygramma]|nr:hypothetical protein DFH06DRAFT_510935 [Mycena polygramma]